MSTTFIDKYGSKIRSLEEETSRDLSEILNRDVKYESSLRHPSDPEGNSEKCRIILTFEFDTKGVED